MKLKKLKPILQSCRVNLYLEFQKPIRFTFDFHDYKEMTSDRKMYETYGEYEIEQIYSGDIEAVNIDLVNIEQ